VQETQFYPEDGGNSFLRDFATSVPSYTASQPTKRNTEPRKSLRCCSLTNWRHLLQHWPMSQARELVWDGRLFVVRAGEWPVFLLDNHSST